MEKEFQVGDRVLIVDADAEHEDYIGKTAIVKNGGVQDCCALVLENSRKVFIAKEEWIKPYAPKTAFLTELKGLLEKYGAKIMLDAKGCYCGDDVDSVTMSFCLNGEVLNYTVTDFEAEITPDNIMDYDKE